MRCQQVTFDKGNCLVEIEARIAEANHREYVARLSVVEDGAIVRPLVSQDGRRVKILGDSESIALDSAIKYLGDRFGKVRFPAGSCQLGAATIGKPLVMPSSADFAAMAS